MRLITSLLLLLILLSIEVFASSTIDCHCFRDRSYNPQNPTAADPYFLATTQNSFLSLVYGLDKKEIVRAKMSGSHGDRLWIQYELAVHSEKSPEKVQEFFQQFNDWRKVIKALMLDPEMLGPGFIQASVNESRLADYIVDQNLIQRIRVTQQLVSAGRRVGMSSKELILGLLLTDDPVKLFDKIKAGQLSWGKKLFDAGLFDSNAINRQLSRRLNS